MMKYLDPKGTLLLAACCVFISLLSPAKADARIGDSRSALEARVTSSGGIIYRDDAIEEMRRKGMPYLHYLEYLGASADVRIYFKTSDGRRPTSSELESKRINSGWDLHVVYVNGKSVIEAYKRSQTMSEYETNQLIALQGGGSGWKKLEKGEAQASAFGYDMESKDGSVRAKKISGDRILFMDAIVDTKLAEMNTSDLVEKAPISVKGF